MTREQAIETIRRYECNSEHYEACEMAIKALEQEPCEDTISRQRVLNLFDKSFFRNWELGLFERKIKDLPSVNPQEPKWIPVSERLPEPYERENGCPKYYLIQNEYGDMLVARYCGLNGWEQMYQDDYVKDEVIAWMPLPKPYEPQERNEKE